jgi:hypothetical protein
MTTTNLDQTREQISTHLRFLGYDVTVDDKTIFARHPKKPNIMLKAFTEGALLTSIYGCDDSAKRDRLGYLEFINTANGNAGIARYYAGKDSEFFIEAWYSGEYRQIDFGRFLDLWDTDFEKLTKLPGIEKYLK